MSVYPKVRYIRAAFVAASALGLLLLWKFFFYSFGQILAALLIVITLLTSMMFFDFSKRMPASGGYPITQLVPMYIIFTIRTIIGMFGMLELETRTRHYKDVQDECLKELLTINRDTAFGRDHNFRSVDTRETFTKLIPLAHYDDVHPYIIRVAKGEKNVLSAEDPYAMTMTSGTTGKGQKLLSVTKSSYRKLYSAYFGISYILEQYNKRFREIRKGVRLIWRCEFEPTEGGLPVSFISSVKQSTFVEYTFSVLNCTPTFAMTIKHEPTMMYIHLLFGLRDREVGQLEANFSGTFYAAMKLMENRWKELVHDIETGYISENADLRIDPTIRHQLELMLSSDPVRAQELRAEFEKGFVGIVARVWPHCAGIRCASGGSMKIYTDILRREHCRDIPFYSLVYGCSEGVVAFNIWPNSKEDRYLLLGQAGFYEFIPEENMDDPQPKTFFADQTEIGGIYELIISSWSGLYRYRMGDVIKITGFHNNCPIFEFLYRTGETINLAGEKTPEPVLRQAIVDAVSAWKHFQLVDFTSANSLLVDQSREEASGEAHGVVFLEVEGPDKAIKLLEEQKILVDTALRNCFAQHGDTSGRLAPDLEIIQLRPGSFEEFRQHYVTDRKGSYSQMKIPRALKRDDDVKFFLERAM